MIALSLQYAVAASVASTISVAVTRAPAISAPARSLHATGVRALVGVGLGGAVPVDLGLTLAVSVGTGVGGTVAVAGCSVLVGAAVLMAVAVLVTTRCGGASPLLESLPQPANTAATRAILSPSPRSSPTHRTYHQGHQHHQTLGPRAAPAPEGGAPSLRQQRRRAVRRGNATVRDLRLRAGGRPAVPGPVSPEPGPPVTFFLRQAQREPFSGNVQSTSRDRGDARLKRHAPFLGLSACAHSA
jgi:hypothetical protein